MPIQILNLPIRIPDLLIPKKDIDLYTWSTIACDQFTSNQTYWNEVEKIVGNAPSTLSLVVPEIYFESPHEYTSRLSRIKEKTAEYVQSNIFETHKNSLMLQTRQSPRIANRKGIIVQLDLNEYDPNPSGNNLLKTTEAIIESRLPKRIETKQESSLDISHVLMLYEDKEKELIRKLEQEIISSVFDTPLMMDGGTIQGHFCNADKSAKILADFFEKKASEHENKAIMAVGDGNHSLMSAKRIWEANGADMNSPERWALVKLINIYDSGLEIEPIHRILFDVNTHSFMNALSQVGNFSHNARNEHSIQILHGKNLQYWTHSDEDKMAIEVIEEIIQQNTELYSKIDFIHDKQEVIEIAKKYETNLGILFPHFDRDSIFTMVRVKRFFPRKSFSLGQGKDKKYYIEACMRT